MSDPRFFDLPGRRPTIGATSVRAIPETAPAADPNDPAVLDLLLKQIIEGGISGATLPGDAYNEGMTQAEMERRALDTVGLVGVSSPVGVPRGALGAGPVRRAPAPEGSYTMEQSRQMMGEPKVPVQQPYSVLSEELGNIQRKSGTIGEFAAELGNKPGVKPEELDFVFGGKDPNQKVTIDEVVKMLEGTPEIKTQVKDINPSEWRDVWFGSEHFNESLPADAPSQFSRSEAVEKNITMMVDNYNENTGTNYKDLGELPYDEKRRIEMHAEEMADEQEKLFRDLSKYSTQYDEGDYRLPHPDQRDGGTGNYEEVLIYTPDAKGNYRGGHWDEPNVILHQRRDVRPIEGKESLHIDELQSDLHQRGRKEGYVSTDIGGRELNQLRGTWRNLADQLNSGQVDGFERKNLTVELIDGRTKVEDLPPMWQSTAREFLDIKKRLDDASKPNDAVPFKKSWAKLGITRAITDAVEKGLDRVSWTGGDIQNLRWQHDIGDRGFVGFYDEMLPSTVKKNFKKYGVEVRKTIDPRATEDILNNAMERLRWEADRTFPGSARIEELINRIDEDRGVGRYDWFNSVRHMQFTKDVSHPNRPELIRLIEEREKHFNDMVKEAEGTIKSAPGYIWYFDITPELKKAVQEKGLPLFSKGLPVQGPPKNGDQYLDRILKGDII